MIPKKEKIRRKSNLPDTKLAEKRSFIEEGLGSSRNNVIHQEQFCATSVTPASTSSPESSRKKANSVGRTTNGPCNKAGNAGMATSR